MDNESNTIDPRYLEAVRDGDVPVVVKTTFMVNRLDNPKLLEFVSLVNRSIDEGFVENPSSDPHGELQATPDSLCSKCGSFVCFVAMGANDEALCETCYATEGLSLPFDDPSHVRLHKIQVYDDEEKTLLFEIVKKMTLEEFKSLQPEDLPVRDIQKRIDAWPAIEIEIPRCKNCGTIGATLHNCDGESVYICKDCSKTPIATLQSVVGYGC